ncbi:hypothetical protein AX16_007690 [Volvariella volvacea WC 439]|nr:hypothetical protein AX16_007690 [Volvariella volvacea WC 439]
MYKLVCFAILFVFALAGRVGETNLTVTDIVNIPDSPVKTACTNACSDTTSRVQACNSDPQCLCRNDTVSSLLACEQCMFTNLIDTFKPMPDFRAGSTPVLGAYSAACAAANITLQPAQTALTLPPAWNGPFVSVIPVPAAIFAVIVGSMLGMSSILILSNM